MTHMKWLPAFACAVLFAAWGLADELHSIRPTDQVILATVFASLAVYYGVKK
jgi:hypothetical protein